TLTLRLAGARMDRRFRRRKGGTGRRRFRSARLAAHSVERPGPRRAKARDDRKPLQARRARMTQTMAHATANADLDSALAEARAEFIRRNPKSQKLYDDACSSLPGGNTRTVLFYSPFPVTMVKGKGANLWDADGKKYVDFLGEYTAGLYGHSHPVIRKAIDQALDDGINRGAHNQL